MTRWERAFRSQAAQIEREGRAGAGLEPGRPQPPAQKRPQDETRREADKMIAALRGAGK